MIIHRAMNFWEQFYLSPLTALYISSVIACRDDLLIVTVL